MTEPLTSIDLQAFIDQEKVAADIVTLDAPTPTVAAAAAVLGVQAEQIVKSVLFMADGQPLLVVASGEARVDGKKLADWLGIARRRVRVANGEKVLRYTGFVPGSVPPFGHLSQLETVVETAVLTQSVVFGGGGDLNALMQLTVDELQRVVGFKTATLRL